MEINNLIKFSFIKCELHINLWLMKLSPKRLVVAIGLKEPKTVVSAWEDRDFVALSRKLDEQKDFLSTIVESPMLTKFIIINVHNFHRLLIDSPSASAVSALIKCCSSHGADYYSLSMKRGNVNKLLAENENALLEWLKEQELNSAIIAHEMLRANHDRNPTIFTQKLVTNFGRKNPVLANDQDIASYRSLK